MNEISDFVIPYLTVHLPQEGKGLSVIEQDGSDYIIAYRNNEIAGYMQQTPEGELLGLVLPKFRRQGIGTELWAEAVALWDAKRPEELSDGGAAVIDKYESTQNS